MTPQQLKALPKVDLHCHLDGSLPLDFMSQQLGRPVDPTEVQAPANCENLTEYLTRFETPLAALTSQEAFRQAGYAVLEEVAAENIRYIELRFAPLLSTRTGLSTSDILEALLDGLAQGKRDFGVHSGVIVCAMRHMDPAQSLAMVQEARGFTDKGVVAADLAGDEQAFPMSQFVELFKQVRRLDLPFTIHAGEQGNTQNIVDALDAGAARLGHGIAMAGHPELLERIAREGVGVETCPISNQQTKACTLEGHPLREFCEAGVLASVNTDNRTVSNTTETLELTVSAQYGHAPSDAALIQLQENAIRTAFAPESLKSELLAELHNFAADELDIAR